MRNIYKIFGGILGFTMGGPIGALVGVALGGMAHNLAGGGAQSSRTLEGSSSSGDFHISFLVLSAIVIKADGKVHPKELEFVRAGFVKMFGKQKANQSFKVFKSVIDQEINTKVICDQIRGYTSHAMRLQLVHFLFQIGLADGHLHSTELDAIRKIANYLYVRSADFDSIHAMFAEKTTRKDYYTILEITPTATNDEVKRAYRKMVKKYHPDKLIDLGADVKAAGKEKFMKVQDAYDVICKERGI